MSDENNEMEIDVVDGEEIPDDEIEKYERIMRSKDEIVTTRVLEEYYPFYNPFHIPLSQMDHNTRVQADIPYERYVLITEERIAYQLGYVLFMDKHGEMESKLKELNNNCIVLLNQNIYDRSNYLVAKNGIPHTVLDFEKLIDFDLSETKILLIGDCGAKSEDEVPENVKTIVSSFVEAGKNLFSFNSGVITTSACFPGYFSYRNGVSTVEKNIIVKANNPEEFVKTCEQAEGKFVRRAGLRRFEVLKEDCQVLVEEIAPSKIPLAVKLNHNGGSIIQFVEFVSEELFSLRSLKIAKEITEKIATEAQGLDAPTAWKSALSLHHHDSFYLGLALQPFYQTFFGLLENEL